MLYIISDGEAFKIGLTSNITHRLEKLQVSNHRKLKVIKTCEGSVELEASIHNRLSPWNIRGEWFSNDALVAAKDMFENSNQEVDPWFELLAEEYSQ